MMDAEDPAKLFHIVIGIPDEEDCPICRAHPAGKEEAVSKGPQIPLVIRELSLSEILRCPCPLCQEARGVETEERPPRPDRD